MSENLEVLTARPMGFCEGVAAADNLLRDVTLAAHVAGVDRVYGYHEIVHNNSVTQEHEANGVQFINDPSEVPDGSIVVTSAHGTGPETIHAFSQKNCLIFDAACPLVTHTHKSVEKARRAGEHVVYVIKSQPVGLHDEVQGTIGHLEKVIEDNELIEDPVPYTLVDIDEDPADVVAGLLGVAQNFRIITQTTLNSDLALRFRDQIKAGLLDNQPDTSVNYASVGDVCPAVRDRQEGVRVLIRQMQERRKPGEVVVVTDQNSKNGRGYAQLAKDVIAQEGLDDFRVVMAQTVDELPADITDGDKVIGITASASTPNRDIVKVLSRIGTDEGTLPVKPFHLKHFDRRSYDEPHVIAGIITEWQEGMTG